MLYRKYRPKLFSEVVGQEHVVRTLRGALTSGRIGHAYLFTGPRGTGKTTLARVFAKALNCEKRKADGDADGVCANCIVMDESRSMSLIEIDAASNRNIDDIRNIKESASVAAAGGGYKIFIIDEVHMLTQHAFNALLKVLEEPPAHVVFMLATTEPHKLLATILSRVQRFDLKKLTVKQIGDKLAKIAGEEKIKIAPEGLMAIARASDGALRDAEVLLSKIIASSEKGVAISAEEAQDILGLIPFKYHPELLGYLSDNNQAEAIGLIQKIHEAGIDMEHFTKHFLEYARRALLAKVNPATLAAIGDDAISFNHNIDPQKLIKIINSFSEARNLIKSSPIPQLPLELAVIELTNSQ